MILSLSLPVRLLLVESVIALANPSIMVLISLTTEWGELVVALISVGGVGVWFMVGFDLLPKFRLSFSFSLSAWLVLWG